MDEEAKKSDGVPTPTPAQPTPVANITDPTIQPTMTTITAPTRRRSRRNRRVIPNVPSESTTGLMTASPVDTIPVHAAAAQVTSDYHLAYHGTAVNPDTGCVAEYPELS